MRLFTVSLVGFLALVHRADAATYTVTTTDDTGAGSLRQAIADANGRRGTDRIDFAIPGDGPHVIQVDTALPLIVETVLLVGLSQPGASCGTRGTGHDLRIVIDGQQQAIAQGLRRHGTVVLEPGGCIGRS